MATPRSSGSQFGLAAIGSIDVHAFVSTARRGFLALGIIAIGALCILFFKPQFTEQFKSLSPYAKVMPEEPMAVVASSKRNLPADFRMPVLVASSANSAMTDDDTVSDADAIRQQQCIGNWLSKRYHIASDAVGGLVSASYRAAKETRLDPLLILAVISVESRFNPFAEGALGAQGLMQVRLTGHQGKIDQIDRAEKMFDSITNIRIGAQILKDDMILGGSLESGLKMYVDTAAAANGASDDLRILTEYQRLKRIATGKNLSLGVQPLVVSAKNHVL